MSFHYVNMPQFVHSVSDGHLVCFQFGPIKHKAVMNIRVQLIVWTRVFISVGQAPSCGIAGFYGKCILNFLKKTHQTIFQGDCTIFTFLSGMRIPVALCLYRHLVLTVFLI